MRQPALFVLLLATLVFLSSAEEGAGKKEHKHHGKHHGHHDHEHHKHHGHHGHGHHHKHHKSEVQNTANATNSNGVTAMKGTSVAKANIAMKTAQTRAKASTEMRSGQLEVNGPVPADFASVFAQGVAKATGCDPTAVKVLHTASQADGVDQINFQAPRDIVSAVQDQASDPDSKLANGPLRLFLVARESETVSSEAQSSSSTCLQEPCDDELPKTPVTERGIDIDTAMPYGDLEPFGREDTAQELTESSVKESDEMVDQLERAEVAEEKRAVFRALTRLRGAAITSFDGVARAQTGNIDEYNKVHKWRSTHPLHHLADEESDITKWAFPDNADF